MDPFERPDAAHQREDEGGDPPCWAGMLDDETGRLSTDRPCHSEDAAPADPEVREGSGT